MANTETIFIYALLEVCTKSCYIGQTDNLLARVADHYYRAAQKRGKLLTRNVEKREWLAAMAESGRLPEVRVLCKCGNRDEAEEREREFIDRAKLKGWVLLNRSVVTRFRFGVPKPLTDE